jgi:hypothetical protein
MVKKVEFYVIFTLIEAWNRSRNEFEANKGIKDLQTLKQVKGKKRKRLRNNHSIIKKIEEANQITQFLEKNLVQGFLKSKDSKPIFGRKVITINNFILS